MIYSSNVSGNLPGINRGRCLLIDIIATTRLMVGLWSQEFYPFFHPRSRILTGLAVWITKLIPFRSQSVWPNMRWMENWLTSQSTTEWRPPNKSINCWQNKPTNFIKMCVNFIKSGLFPRTSKNLFGQSTIIIVMVTAFNSIRTCSCPNGSDKGKEFCEPCKPFGYHPASTLFSGKWQ